MNHPLAQFVYCPKCGSHQFVEHNGKSKHCEACGFTYYFNPSAATVALIVNERDELLAVRRAKEPAKGTLDLPGGFIDMFETAEQGVAREVAEETGLKVTATRYLFSLPNLYEYSGFMVHTMDLFYECQVASFDRIKAMDDAADLTFIPKTEVNPLEFGLGSIRKGVMRYLEQF